MSYTHKMLIICTLLLGLDKFNSMFLFVEKFISSVSITNKVSHVLRMNVVGSNINVFIATYNKIQKVFVYGVSNIYFFYYMGLFKIQIIPLCGYPVEK